MAPCMQTGHRFMTTASARRDQFMFAESNRIGALWGAASRGVAVSPALVVNQLAAGTV